MEKQTSGAATANPSTPQHLNASTPQHLSTPANEVAGEEGLKWAYLEHNGVVFPENYKPRGLGVWLRGKRVPMDGFQEELAWYWVQSRGTEFAGRAAYARNFETEFLAALEGTGVGEASLADFDFSEVEKAMAAEKEAREAQTREEKETARAARAAEEAPFRHAIIDWRLEKIANFRIEPPTLFKGRGEHPKAGRLKQRIVPEDVSLNLAKEAPIPRCGAAGRCWGDPVFDREASWLASYAEPILQSKKYVFLAAGSRLKGQSDVKKFEKAKRLSGEIAAVRADYRAKMAGGDRKEKQLGTAAYLIDFLAIRAGNEKGEDEADTVGCCSLRVEHLSFPAEDTLRLCFLGKDSIEFDKTVKIDHQAWLNLVDFCRGRQPRDDAFDLISASKLNDYLSSLLPGLTAKVFRTFNASATLERELTKPLPSQASLEDKLKFYNEANTSVAVLCNHQKTVSEKARAGLEKQEQKLAEVTARLKKIKKTDPEHRKLEKGAKKLEAALKVRNQTMNVALSTSKINYNDPRISVAWCKKNEVPIEKIFSSVMLEKFTWAMDSPSLYQFVQKSD